LNKKINSKNKLIKTAHGLQPVHPDCAETKQSEIMSEESLSANYHEQGSDKLTLSLLPDKPPVLKNMIDDILLDEAPPPTLPPALMPVYTDCAETKQSEMSKETLLANYHEEGSEKLTLSLQPDKPPGSAIAPTPTAARNTGNIGPSGGGDSHESHRFKELYESIEVEILPQKRGSLGQKNKFE